MFALNCDRAKKVITHEGYAEKTTALMAQLDELFVQRDEVAGSKSQAFHDSLTMAGIDRLLEEAKNQETLDQTTCACLLKSAIAKPDGAVEFELKNGVVLTGRLPLRGWGTGKAKRAQSEDGTEDGDD